MALYIYNGKLLISEGALAVNEACCCGAGDTWCLYPASLYADWDVDCVPVNGQCPDAVYGYQATRFCSPVCDLGPPAGTHDIIPFPTSLLPVVSGARDCFNLCYATPNAGTSQLTTTQYTRNAGSITTTHGPTFEVTIDDTYLNTDFPVWQGWKIYYVEEQIYAEEKTYECAYGNSPHVCIGSRAKIEIIAIKDCEYGGPELTNVTTNAITASAAITAGASGLSINDYVRFARDDGGCSPPSYLGWTGLQYAVCSTGCPPLPSGDGWI